MSIADTLPAGLANRPSSVPLGFHVESLCLQEAGIRWGDPWEELLHQTQTVSPTVWPAAISEELRRQGRAGHVQSRSIGLWNEHDLEGLALLPAKTISLGSLLKPLPAGKIQGLRLAGNQIFTNGSESSLHRLVDAVGEELKRQRARFLLIEDLETNSPLHREIERLTKRGYRWFWQTQPQPRFQIRLPATAGEYWGTFSSKSRYNLRRQERLFPEARLLRITTPEKVSEFLDLASQISRNSWQYRQIGTRIRKDEQEQRYLKLLAEQGQLQSYILLGRGEPAAFLFGLRTKEAFFYEEIGYDPRFAEYSPGTVLLYKAINELYETSPVPWFDFGFGDAPYKRLFANHQTESGKGWLLPPGFQSWQLQSALEARRKFQVWGRSLLDRLGWWQQFRRRSRQGTFSESSTTSESAS